MTPNTQAPPPGLPVTFLTHDGYNGGMTIAYDDRGKMHGVGTLAGMQRKFPDVPYIDILPETPQGVRVAEANAKIREQTRPVDSQPENRARRRGGNLCLQCHQPGGTFITEIGGHLHVACKEAYRSFLAGMGA